MTKICTSCKEEKVKTLFYKRGDKPHLLQSRCKECVIKWNNSQARKTNYAKSDKRKKYLCEYRQFNKEKIALTIKEWQDRNKVKYKENAKRYEIANKDKRREQKKEYFKKNKREFVRRTAEYRARLIKAQPDWLTEEHKKQIADIYKNCPKGFHVDHIIPLKGKNVCGLHTPWNLQYLTATENKRKNNRVEGI